jgi:outer membrane protein
MNSKWRMFYLCIPLVLLPIAQAGGEQVAELSVSEDSLTLKDCYTLALERSETIGIQKELIKETEGQMLQALSTALPKVAFAYSQEWQDVKTHDNFGGSSSVGAFTFTQPLFTGFKEFAALRASKSIGRQRKAELKRAQQLLFTDVSDAFFLYLSYQDDEETLNDTRNALLERAGELKKRQVIGKSRPSEIASAEAKLRSLEAAQEGIRVQKEVAGQLLEFLVGRPFSRLVDEGDPDMSITISEALVRVNQRPDVVAAEESLNVFKQNIVVARSSFFPTVTLTGNSYTKRLDANEGNDWDATLSVNVPLFNGMNDFGQVAQARAQKNEAELKLSQVKRLAMLNVRNAYALWQANGRRVAAFEKAFSASEKNYRLQVEDFDRSLVNNLDVLQALEDLYGVRQDLTAAKAEGRRSFWALKVAIGEDLP